MTSSHHVSFSCSWPGGSLRLSWFEWPQWFGGGLGSDAQTVPLLACLMFFSLLVWACGFGEEDHRGEVPFSSRPARAVLSTWLLTMAVPLVPWLRCICHVSPLGSFSFFPYPCRSPCGDVTTRGPHLRGVLGPIPRGQSIHIYDLECFHTDVCLLTYSLFFPSVWAHVCLCHILVCTPALYHLFCCSKHPGLACFSASSFWGPLTPHPCRLFEYYIPFWHYKMLNTFDFDINRATFHF